MDGALTRSYGRVFNEVASDYDRHRPGYPDELIDHVCEVAGIGPGDEVLEIGCGSGQLTASLLARGLRVTAVEPGERLLELAAEKLGRPDSGSGSGSGDLVADGGVVEFVCARLEDAVLPRGHYRAVMSAAAFHWTDPDVSWRLVSEALAPGGTFALIQHFGASDERSAEDQQQLLSVIQRIAPEVALDWPVYRDLETALAGVRERRANLSEVWAWLGNQDVARPYAGELFDDAEIAAVPLLLEHTADEINAIMPTFSWWAKLSEDQRRALIAENQAIGARLGRPIRSSVIVAAVTARLRDPLRSARPRAPR
jgi:SAM-dependent methyltransferase